MSNQIAALLRGHIADIAAGSIFLFIGLATCSIAAIGRRRGVRILGWLGVWSAMYGAAQLTQSPPVVAASPGWVQGCAPYVASATAYLILVPASLSFLELSLGRLRHLIKGAVLLGFLVGIGGVLVFASTGSRNRFMLFNNLIAAGVLLILALVAAVPRLSRRYLALRNSDVLLVGILAFAGEALYNSLARPLGLDPPHLLNHLGFAALLFSLGYVALQLVFTNERRLLAVDNELEIARRMQLSILPSGVPDIERLRISAVYRPMTAVAGDFYDFIAVDRKHIGILVADAAGHGVPAALSASMIKVALQSVTTCADDPSAVLRGLNRLLSKQAQRQFISAAYLWFDMENRSARYSAAGHPPLIRCRDQKIERIESNGFLIGMAEECDYPVATLSIAAGDRLLLCTDGVIEAESDRGDFFGEGRIEDVVTSNQGLSAAVFSETLLSEIDRWRSPSVSQQDDITLVVMDVI